MKGEMNKMNMPEELTAKIAFSMHSLIFKEELNKLQNESGVLC